MFQARKLFMATETLAGACNGTAITHPDPQRTYQVVVAATRAMGIGKDGKLPWRLPSDLKFFKDVTMSTTDPAKKNAIIMGRKTWESIPLEHRPLTGRLNVVLTRSGSFDIATAENVLICGSMTSALELLASSPYCLSIERVFVIGGGQILRDSLNAPGCDAIHITEIETDINFEAPTEVNGTLSDVKLEPTKFDARMFSFLPKKIFENHEEYLYLKLVEDIISNGALKGDRTGTGTLSKFGCQMRFNLRKSFPLLTTKKVFWRGVVEELLWFISGSTSAKYSIGLVDREEGDLGSVYGFQWRHFGASMEPFRSQVDATSALSSVCTVLYLVPGDFVYVFGHAHVYSTHVRPLQDQLQKIPKPFP
ncbi:bifunctional dihydrofolate reductase-thymidylate synthase 1-like protein, partial [Tanacetum coccineum]